MTKVVARFVIAIYHAIAGVYWLLVRSILRVWGERGLHRVKVGSFSAGSWKTRSMYREDMLLRAIPFFVDINGRTCLDLACNNGTWMFHLGRLGLVGGLGVDYAREAILQANLLKSVNNFRNLRFRRSDILQFLFENNANTYDIVLLLSIIYHLPEHMDWERFFGRLGSVTNECLVVDTRWFDNDEYWYDKTPHQAFIFEDGKKIPKWRPTRREVFNYLHRSGFDYIVEVNPSPYLPDEREAYGDGDPYSLENVADYLSGNRSLVFAYKNRLPNLEERSKIAKIVRDPDAKRVER